MATPTSAASQRSEPRHHHPRELRNVFGQFATGVTVVTCTSPDGTPHGATVNAFTAVSLEPALVQVTLVRGNKASEYLADAPFAVNIMSTDQLDVCLHFAGKPKPGPVTWRCEDGIPVLEGNAATIECQPWRTYDGGDHVIVIGEVTTFDIGDKPPLLFHAGAFRTLGAPAGGTPWDYSGDSLDCSWFGGSNELPTF